MGRSSRNALAAAQAAEAQRILDLAKLPPPPGGLGSADLPRIQEGVNTWLQPEFVAYEQARQEGNTDAWRSKVPAARVALGLPEAPPASVVDQVLPVEAGAGKGNVASVTLAGDASNQAVADALTGMSNRLSALEYGGGYSGDYQPAGFDLAGSALERQQLEAEAVAAAEEGPGLLSWLALGAVVLVALYVVTR